MTALARARRFFFMHLGTFVAVIVYFNLCGNAGYSAEGVARALTVSLGTAGAYAALAAWQGELKQFDLGVLALFAVGALGAAAGVTPVVRLFQVYSPALLFIALGTTALVSLLPGREPFTLYFARRQIPAWQQKTPEFHAIARLMVVYWVALFLAGAALAAWSPRDWRFTLLYPNLLVFALGVPAPLWVTPLYMRLRPPSFPETIEGLFLGMPFVFDRRAAAGARATIQFRVSGAEPGAYHLRIEHGRCESASGEAPAPDLIIDTPDHVWMRIARGDLDGGQALAEGLFRAEGDATVLTRLETWFPRRGRSAS